MNSSSEHSSQAAFDLPPTIYTNMIGVSSSLHEVILTVGENISVSTEGGKPQNIFRPAIRLAMSPLHAKSLIEVLSRAIEKYEEIHGSLNLESIKPKGEAPVKKKKKLKSVPE